MADSIPDWAASAPATPAPSASAPANAVPDWAMETTTPTRGDFAWSSAITDIPAEIGRTFSRNLQAAEAPFKPQPQPTGMFDISQGERVGEALAAVPGMALSPITGAARSLIGHTYANAAHALGDPGTEQALYEKNAADAETALMALGARGGVRPVPVPPRPTTGPFGVTLSEGQSTGELPLIQREQAALRGNLGDPAQARAQEFADQQRAQLNAARENVQSSLNPYGALIAETPQEAGSVVSQAMQSTAAARKAQVTQAYRDAQAYPGEIHAGVFEGIGQGIKGDLSLRPEPVVIDDHLTPYASRAIQDVDNRIAQLRIQNRADPFGQPNQENIAGVNLRGVDQMRKRLSSFRQQAFASGNAADGRAAQAVLDAFDDRIDSAINGGQFNGDPAAVQAWNDARAAYSDYRRTFTGAKNDPVGRVVEKILGRSNSGPTALGPATPNDVADFIYGAPGVNPSTLNVAVVNRLRNILGERSPEWSAVRQGLFSRLVEPTPGMTDWGPGRVAQRLNQFLNGDGREMAQTLFSPQERQMLQAYANLHRQLQIPQAGANWSQTSTFVRPMLRAVANRISGLLGAVIGHAIMPGLGGEVGGYLAGEAVGSVARSAQANRAARDIAGQMPLIAQQMRQWQNAVARANRLNTPPSRAAATVAATNLSRTLEPFGINLSGAAANAQDQNNGQSGSGRNQPSSNNGRSSQVTGQPHAVSSSTAPAPKFASPADVHTAIAAGSLKSGDHFLDANGNRRMVP